MQAMLAVFLADPARARYGLEISDAAELPSGTIYPALARLERAGWVKSEWQIADGQRPRRYYRLTGEGESEARSILADTLRQLRPVFQGPADVS
jgi:PadR family transcriptional regulator, regulatory protein PadR